MGTILTKFANGHPPKKHIWDGLKGSNSEWTALCGAKYRPLEQGVWTSIMGSFPMVRWHTISCWECRKKYAAERKKYDSDSE